MGIQARLFLVPPAAAAFGAAAVAAMCAFALPGPVPSPSLALLAAAGAAAAALPAMILCRKWCVARRTLDSRAGRFNSIWESKLMGIFSVDPDSIIREANPTFMAMTGYAEADLRAGIRIKDLMAAENPERGEFNRERFDRDGRLGPIERDWIRKDGVRFASLVYASRQEGGDSMVMIMDINEWKATQRELRLRESRYRSLLSSRLLGIFVTDMQGKISEANDTFLSMIHRTRSEMEAGIITSQGMATPEWLYGAEARRDLFQAEGSMGPIEREWNLQDGGRLHSLFFVTRLEDSAKALCMVVDANELKQTRLKLHTVESRYKKLFDSNIVGIAIMDGNQVFLEANATFLSMVGYDRMDLAAGRLTSYALRLPDSEREQMEAEAKAAGQGRLLPREIAYLRKDGTRVPVFRGVTRLEEADRFLIIAIDLSVLRATQAEGVAAGHGLPLEAGAEGGQPGAP